MRTVEVLSAYGQLRRRTLQTKGQAAPMAPPSGRTPTMRGGGRWKREAEGSDVGLTVKRFTRKTHPRASGQAARRLPRLTKFFGRRRLQAA